MVEALVAAQPTVDDDRRAYSLHSHFLRPSRPTVPILQEVDRIGGGRSFALRRIVAIQHRRAVFNMLVRFHVRKPARSTALVCRRFQVPKARSAGPTIWLRSRMRSSRRCHIGLAGLDPSGPGRATSSLCSSQCSRTHP
ncbi:MAG: acyl-CoA thioesterase [Acidimicrobiales bacterium]